MGAHPPPPRRAYESPELGTAAPPADRSEVDDRTLNIGRAILLALLLLVVIGVLIVLL
jgi:hypothetical protein